MPPNLAPSLQLRSPQSQPPKDGLVSPPIPYSTKAAGPLSSKVTSVLSTSYADSEFRDALQLLDDRSVLNTTETRRQLRLGLQKQIIDSNGEIIDEFGKVAEVRLLTTTP